MKLYTFISLCVAAYILIHFFLIPEVDRKWSASKSFEKLTKAGLLASFKATRTLVQMALITYCTAVLGVWSLGIWSNGTTTRYIAIIDKAEAVRDWLKSFQDGIWGPITCGLAILALVIIAYRRHHQELSDEVGAVVKREYARLEEVFKNNVWEEQPPTAEMSNEIDRLTQLTALKELLLKEESNPQQSETLMKLEAAIPHIQQKIVELDLLRRMDLSLPPTEERTSSVRRWWPRIRTFLTSKALAADTGFVGKMASRSATAAFFVCLLGVSGPLVTNAVESRLVSLWDMEVKAARNEAKASWEQVTAKDNSPSNTTLSPDEANAINNLARLIVRENMTASAWITEDARAIAYRERSSFVKDEIIAKAKLNAPVRSVDGFSNTKLVSELSNMAQIVDSAKARPDHLNKQESWVAQQTAKHVATINHALWAKIQDKITVHIKDYGVPATPADFAKTLLGEIIDPAVDAIVPEGDSEYTKKARGLVTKGIKEATQRALETKLNRVLRDLAGTDSLRDALAHARLEEGHYVITPMEKQALADLMNHVTKDALRLEEQYRATPAAFVEALDQNAASDKARELALGLIDQAKKGSNSLSEMGQTAWVPDFLDTYEDHFPNREENKLATLRSQIMIQAVGNTDKKDSVNAVKRAYNYALLDTYHKTGGIVIGRPPENHTSLTGISRLQWTMRQDGQVEIFVVRQNGERVAIGQFNKSLAYLALLYAADTRPLTVTIINTQLPGAQRVLLHPALVDTEFGCETIQFDKFIFKYTDKDTKNKIDGAMKSANALDALYRFANWSRIRAVTIEKDLVDMEFAKFNFDAIPLILKSNITNLDIEQSPLTKLPNWYDPSLVEEIRSCLKGNLTPIGFSKCIVENNLNPTDKEYKSWYLHNPPNMSLVSGIREAKYILDNSLNGLKKINDSYDKYLTFKVQTVFDSRENDASAAWVVESLSETVNQGMRNLIASNHRAKEIMSNTRDFVILQRLFRLAFNGNFGDEFEVESLADFARTLQSNTPPHLDTPRWEPHDKSLKEEMLNLLKALKGLSDVLHKIALTPSGIMLADATKQLEARCNNLVNSSAVLVYIQPDVWGQSCDFASINIKSKQLCGKGEQPFEKVACNTERITSFGNSLNKKRELMRMLGIREKPSDTQLSQNTCRASL